MMARLTGSGGEDPCQKAAYHTTDAVEFEDVLSLVDAKPLVQVLEESTHNSGDEANSGRKLNSDIASRRRDSHQTSDLT
jgi:hypothetical protein